MGAPDEYLGGEDIVPVEEYADAGEPDAIVMYRKPEAAIEDLTWNPEAAVAAVKGMPLAIADDNGKRRPTLYYDIPYRSGGGSVSVRGPSAPLMRALVAQRGNFETISVEITQGVQIIPEVGQNNERHVEQVPAIRAVARVRDLMNNNVTIGVCTEPMFERRRGGDAWFARPQAEGNAASKALRNARAEHFAPVIPLLMQVLVKEFDAGHEVVRGELPEAVVAGAAEAVRDRAARENHEAVPVGVVGAQAFFDEMGALKALLTEKQWEALRHDWKEAGPIILSGRNLQDAPMSKLPRCREWLDQKKTEFGIGKEAAPAGEEAPAFSADGKPQDQYQPTESDVRTILASLDEKGRAEAYRRAGVKPDEELDPVSAKALWTAANALLAGGKHQKALDLGK